MIKKARRTPRIICECGRSKEPFTECCARCAELDAVHFGTGRKKVGFTEKPEKVAGVRRALNRYLKEKGLE